MPVRMYALYHLNHTRPPGHGYLRELDCVYTHCHLSLPLLFSSFAVTFCPLLFVFVFTLQSFIGFAAVTVVYACHF